MSNEENHKLTKEQIDKINELRKDTTDVGRETFQNYSIDALLELHGSDEEEPGPGPEPEPKLPDDGREQFYKNGNMDANTWKVVPMHDDPSLYKIVDDDGINIADLFHSQATAEQFIAYYIWKQEQPEPGEGEDKFGIKKIYPDKSGNLFEVSGGGDVEEHGDYRREWEIATPPYEAVEVTGHFKVNIQREDTISLKLKGAKHTGSEPQYSACCNIHYVPFSGTGKTLGKQCPHLNYKEKDVTPKFTLGDIRNKWVGIKAVEWNENGNVHWQTWIDENVDNNWKLWVDFVEANCSIGDDDDTCPPFTKSPWAGSLPPTILIRVDFPEKPPANDVEARYISCREIKIKDIEPLPGRSTTKDGVTVPHRIKGEWIYDYDTDERDGGARYNFRKTRMNSLVMVGYFKVDGGDDDVSGKILGGRHTDSAPYDGCIYDPAIGTEDGKPRLRCECPHPDYTGNMDLDFSKQGVSCHDRWVGYMTVALQEEDGVRVQMFQDQGDNDTEPANQWVKILEFFDDGSKVSGIKGADRFPLRTVPESGQNTYRIDESPGLTEKWLALAEIDVN